MKELTPLDIANCLCNLPRDLQKWLVSLPKDKPSVLLHAMKVYPPGKMRVECLERYKEKPECLELLWRILALSDEEFMAMLRASEKTS